MKSKHGVKCPGDRYTKKTHQVKPGKNVKVPPKKRTYFGN